MGIATASIKKCEHLIKSGAVREGFASASAALPLETPERRFVVRFSAKQATDVSVHPAQQKTKPDRSDLVQALDATA